MKSRAIDRDHVRAAVVAVEARTSGQIVVAIAPWFWGGVERAAQRAFRRLRIGHTRHRNGVLVFVVPARRCFTVLGDDALHDAVGQAFWDRTVSTIAERFKTGDLTAGIICGVELIGDELARHFPRGAEDVNELPEVVETSGRSSLR